MRIHRLEIQAFGPFAERQVVDFDELGAQGLFLLNGPTGAGKTSVLDAICFALYGSVPGARQAARKLRSDHAAPGTAPEVVLDFSAGPRRFEVVRSPQWERPAKRAGSTKGTVTEQARTLLRELVHGEWVQKTTRNDEAATEIQDLLGMSSEQFTRVVMLPQGDFAAFLRADATSRADLLQRLFGTWRFEEIERQLKEQTADAQTELAQAQSSAELIVAQVQSEAARCIRLLTGGAQSGTGDEASTEVSDPAFPAEPDEDPAAWLAAIRTAVGDRLTTVRTGQEHRKNELSLAEATVHKLQARRARGLALLQLEAEERELAARQAASAPQREALAAHTRAEGLAGYLAACDSAGRAMEKAAADAGSALAGLAEAAGAAGLGSLVPGSGTEPGALPWPGPGELEGLETATASDLSAAEAALADADRLAGLERELEKDRALEVELRDKAAQHHAAAAQLRTEQAGLRAALPDLRARAAGTESARNRVEQAEQLISVIAEYAKAQTAAATSAEAAATARQDYQDRRGAWQDLLQLRLDQAAAELAASLEPGGACPVCGSCEHPAPAPLPHNGKFVGREEETAARTSSEAAEKFWEDARAAAAADAAAAAALQVQGGDGDPADALQARETAAAQLARAEAAAAEQAAIEARLQALEVELDSLSGAESNLLQEAALAQARLRAATAEAAALRSRSADLTKGAASLQERVDSLRAVRRLCGAARSALQAVAYAENSHQTSRQALDDALDGTGFPDADSARAALLPAAEAERLRSALDALDADAARVAMRRESEDAAASLDSGGDPAQMPDEEDLAEAAEAADAARKAVSDGGIQTGLLEGSAATLQELAGKLADATEAVRPLHRRFELLQSVTDTARGNGDNNYRMALSTYVLAARLEQVAAAATERLAAMTAGRYSLVHDDSRSGNRKAGLGLHVIDAWTGVRRDTSTLSGGESFMASLALALGLADVVQQESGGTSMETLFVDEGFGSLDEEALEQVMDALEGLRDGGRVVGLVSHVAEMKQRIGAQLQITRGRNGSSIRFRAADALPA
ncbi:SMC family ATPase [Arthrobacter sp. Sa2BUA2]|uniref:Nuclease SbcCD subunit C n=1 Tax=Arthrobacter pullicola TaxID=2762224 RepID=A0ABR8YJD7_9MICC|nr:SMC family ATPase [Arthrobacter pullicola]MBD8044324.1 SMC family ATPase [Arthrobacter pullicola]